MRRTLAFIVLGLSLMAPVPVIAQTAQVPETVGIRIVDVPTIRTDDPRARQYIVDHLEPGTTITRRVEINNDTKAAQVVQLYAAAASVSEGTFRFGDDRAVNELSTWTTVDPAQITPAAGEKILANVQIAVPIDASPGERYAVVWAELAPAVAAGGGVTAVNRVGVRVYLSVGPGGEPASDFVIDSIEARRDADGSPIVAANVTNTGGRAVDLSGELLLTNGPGGLSAGPFTAELGTTLARGESEPVLVKLDPAIPAGPWDATIVLRSGLLERQGTARITFPAGAGSSSPAVPATTTTTTSAPVEVVPREDEGLSALILLAAGIPVAFMLLLLVGRRRSRRERKDR